MPRRGENIQKRVETRMRSDGSSYDVERWVSYVDLGSDPITGERQRKAVAADTYGEVKKLRRELLEQRDRGVKAISGKGWTVARWCRHWVDTVIKTEMNEGTYVS